MRKFALARKPIFFSIAGIIILMLMVGCSSTSTAEIWAEGKPKHHTQNGFRNYPVISDPPPVGAAFYVRRVMGSLFLPDVPDEHALSEAESMTQFQQLSGENSITWLGHTTFLIRLNGMTISD